MIIDDGIRKTTLMVYPSPRRSSVEVIPPIDGVKSDELVIAREIPWRGVVYTKSLKGEVKISGSEKSSKK